MMIFGSVMIVPFVWMLSASFKPESEVFNYPVEWIPSTWRIVENYSEVWFGRYPFATYYWNSIKVSLTTTALSALISSMAAYGFAKIPFKGRDALFLLVLATYMIPHQATLVPQFLMYRWIGLFDTHTGLILLSSFSVLGTFLLRQFFMGISNEFMEAARMDGAGHFTIFTRILLPLMKPAIATYAILRFIWTWNDYQNPLIFLRSGDKLTLQIGLAKFSDSMGTYYSLIMAGSVSAIIPLLIIFIIGQRQVIEGIASGGIKG
ncbi:carbohydrate ABC transporter permease [Paenibacillus thalictri]|uniref:Carbohydrate ABC transporter permease n=1 Tax=Paenibacillus thalictri TaxID=2527873 RepID=A0A4Q9DNA1_9BACL|nr:carbohydrate ABC transporter permease [Paenibacillus thalictri]TBL74698.1 carbohydrate ABC transporter permease [Paenibacillus thalictri]